MKPKYVEEIEWKGERYVLEFFDTPDFSGLHPKTQATAICFPDSEHVVLFQHADGYLSIPGGTIESGETPEDALRREVWEESSCEIIDFGPIGYFKAYRKDDPSNAGYQLRYWAKVDCKPETLDPDGKALHRVVVPRAEVVEQLGWGNRIQILIDLAYNAYQKRK